jgi:alpha-tubulin suppressor-like RCC1 family protein
MKYFIYLFSFLFIFSMGCTKKAKKKTDPDAVLSVTPATPKVQINQTLKLIVNATDAIYRVSSGEGTVGIDGSFSAPATAQTVIVTVHGTPPKGKTAVDVSVTIVVYEPLTAAISTGTIYQFGGQAQITITGGAQPVSIQNSNSLGSVDTNKLYASPDKGGITTLSVVDAANNRIIFDVLVIPRINITSTQRSAYINQSVPISAADGKPPFNFTMLSGNGSVDAVTGLYTASAIKGLDTIRATDALGDTTDVSLQIMDPLTLTSTGTTMLTMGALNFTAAGGAPPYIYAVVGVGAIDSTGVFTSNQPGNAIVGVSDLAGNTANVGVIVFDPLLISPTTKNIIINANAQFSASGGVNPLSFSVVNVGGGSINTSTGLYNAPALSGAGLVRVIDSLGNQSDATINIGIPMAISPTTATLQTGNLIGFTATGGFSPYGFSVINGGVGSILSNGTYSSNIAGNATVVVTDITGATASANLTIFTTLTISPTTKNLATNSSFKFAGVGGIPPLTFSKVSGGGSINATSGTYTAPATGTTTVVRVNDTAGHSADATITVTPPLALTAATGVTITDTNVAFTATGGQSPYGFSLQVGSVGTILADGTFFSNTAGSATVIVTDVLGNSASTPIFVITPLSLNPTSGSLLVSTTATFNATGGDTAHPYVFSVPTLGGGSVNASNGIYSAPASPISSATIRVSDYYGNFADAIVKVASNLTIAPVNITTPPNTPSVFTGTGGFTPYAYSIQSGVGSVLNDGTFNSPTTGSSVVLLTDVLGHTATANVIVVANLVISPNTIDTYVNSLVNFSATGGDTSNPYSYSILSGGGVINSNTGVYNTAATATLASIRVSDNFGLISDAIVNVASEVTLTPGTTLNALTNTNYTFTASGGYPTYTYSLQGGSVGMILGLNNFSSALTGNAVVIATDQNGHTASTNINVYNSVVITAGTNSITTNANTSINATGGSGSYTYSVTSGLGSVSQISNNGTFTASSGTGTTIIRATDTVTGFYGETTINVLPGVVISPKTYKLTTLTPLIFNASGGFPGYTYTIQSGNGSITGNTYTAGVTSDIVVIKVTDSQNNFDTANITIEPPLNITQSSYNLAVNANYSIPVNNGFPPYTYTVIGVGSVSGGTFTSNTAGSGTVNISDTTGAFVSTSITVYNPLTITPTTKYITTNGSFQFNSTGGFGAKSYSVNPALGGTIDVTGMYTASVNSGSYIIRVTDSYSNTADANVVITTNLVLPPPAPYVITNNNITFVPSGGLPNYTFIVVSGTGVIDANTGVFSSTTAGTTTIQVSDTIGTSATASIKIFNPLTISTTAATNSFVNTGMLFTATGGDTSQPYVFTLMSGGGILNATTGSYVTAGTATTATVRVIDNSGLTAQIIINVAENIIANPGPTLNALTNTNYNFSATGGYPPYTFELQPDSVGLILAPGDFSSVLTGLATVIVKDKYNNSNSTLVTVYNPVIVTSGTSSIITSGTTSIVASGGSGVYSYAVTSGGGSATQIGNSAIFTGPTTAGTSIITVADTPTGFIGQTTVVTVPAVSISPKTYKLTSLTSLTFTSAGGFSPYSYSIQSGGGSITGNTYTAPAGSDVVVLKVQDSANNSDIANITIEPSLSISQTSYNLAINTNYLVPVANGFPPYTYTISGVGTLSGGTFSSTNAGNATVIVTDTIGATVTSNILVYNLLTISPTTKNILTNGTTTFTTTGGIGTKTFSVVNVGGGTINGTSGFYTAPPASITAVVRVTDGIGVQADATLTVNGPLSLTSNKNQVVTGATATFTASQGFPNPSYIYSVQGGGVGSIDSTGIFTSNISGTSVIIASDSMTTATSTITVYDPLTVSPVTKNLTTNSTLQFSSAGGFGGYNYSVIPASGGNINASGFFTALTNTGTYVIHLIDSDSNFADATVYIAGPLALTPSSAYAITNTPITFNAAGGFPSYSYTIVSGSGTLSAPGNSYSSPTAGTVSVRVTDTDLTTATSTIVVYQPLLISTTATNTFVSSNINFTASGGDSSHNYSFSVVNGGGDGYFSNPTTGVFVTSSTATTTLVKVTDFLGQTAQMNINVAVPLTVNYYPTLNTVSNSVYTFATTGGYPGYTYQVVSGVGNFTAGGDYTSASTGTASIKVSDLYNNFKMVAVNVYSPVTVAAGQSNLITGGTTSVLASGGAGTYTYSIQSGGGNLTQNGGYWTFTAPASAGTSAILATDLLGFTGTTNILTALPLAMTPSSTTVQTFSVTSFSASGGVPNASAPYYTYSIISGGGSIDSASGFFTAPPTPETVVIKVSDSQTYVTANIEVVGPVSITPSSKNLAVNNSTSFSASGGAPPFTFTISSGSGSIIYNMSTATYTAPASLAAYPGNAIVQVQDAFGSTAVSTVTINAPITITPSGWTLVINEYKKFSASGGVPPYTYTTTAGSIGTTTGSFKAAATSNSTLVTTMDSLGNQINATVNVNDILSINPVTDITQANTSFTFSSSGGVPPYNFTISGSAGGVVNPLTGAYTSGSIVGTDIITLSDSAAPAHTTIATISVYEPLVVSPITYSIIAGDVYNFIATGGYGSYTWSLQQGTGFIDANGNFEAPIANETDVLRVSDDDGNFAEATITVTKDIAINPTVATLSSNDLISFSSTGGLGSKTYTIVGSGSINSTTGTFTAPITGGTTVVTVTDSVGATTNATLTLIVPTQIYAGGNHSCVLFDGGQVKCWGDNSMGQLGIGITAGSMGMAGTEMGVNLPFVSLGTNGESAKSLSLGYQHTCAILNNDQLKCWGSNTKGQLGRDNTVNIGTLSTGTLALQNINPITLGTTVNYVSAGYTSTCAILKNDTVKCWGASSQSTSYGGMFGRDIASANPIPALGDAPGEMATVGTSIIGVGIIPITIQIGFNHTCMIGLIGSTNIMKCWGGDSKNTGQNGMKASSANRGMGDAVGEMATIGTFIFGSGTLPVSVSSSYMHNCAILSDLGIKCWGDNSFGQLGIAHVTNTAVSSATPSANGNLIAVTNTSLGDSPLEISVGQYHNCATVNTSPTKVKCWGSNLNGQLGYNSATTANKGDTVNEMGAALPYVSVSQTGAGVLKIAAGYSHTCALLTDKTLRCWGLNTKGQLGRGDALSPIGANTANQLMINVKNVKLTGH